MAVFKLIFSNRYAALVWLGLTLFGAAAFVGKGGGVDALDETAQKWRGQQEVLDQDQTAADAEASGAEEEEPAIEPSEAAPPEPGDVVTGEDGRRYRVVQTPASTQSEPAATQTLVN